LKQLKSTLVEDLVDCKTEKKIYDVLLEDTVRDVHNLLAEKKILSVPVRVEKGCSDYLGMVDVLDVVFFVLYKVTGEPKTVEEVQWSSWCQDLGKLQVKGEELGDIKVEKLFSEDSVYKAAAKWTPVSQKGTLSQLLELFAAGVHRVAVTSHMEGYVRNIVSQSDVLAYISKHQDLLGDWADKSLEEVGLATGKDTSRVICMAQESQVIHAFYLMYYNDVHAVAIVDSEGELCANISASDVRGLSDLSMLLLPVMEYLREVNRHSPPKAPLTVLSNTCLKSAINKMAMYRVHRLWIVDGKGKPTGVVAIQDILKLFDIPE
jgi:CBS domain-containing protein